MTSNSMEGHLPPQMRRGSDYPGKTNVRPQDCSESSVTEASAMAARTSPRTALRLSLTAASCCLVHSPTRRKITEWNSPANWDEQNCKEGPLLLPVVSVVTNKHTRILQNINPVQNPYSADLLKAIGTCTRLWVVFSQHNCIWSSARE